MPLWEGEEACGVRRSAEARKQQLINHQSARKREPIMDGVSWGAISDIFCFAPSVSLSFSLSPALWSIYICPCINLDASARDRRTHTNMSRPRRQGWRKMHDVREMYYRSTCGIKNRSNRSLACRRNGDEDGHASIGGINGDGMVKDKYGKINLSGISAGR